MATSAPTSRSGKQGDPQQRPLLPCILFLNTHLEQGGIDEHGHKMLYKMIQMMSAIGWEVQVILQHQYPRPESVANMLLYCKCILEVCEVFSKNMTRAVQKANDAIQKLPGIEKQGSEEERETKIKQWRWKLKTLHHPTGNDIRLFKLIYNHYHDHVYERVVRLRRKKPEYYLGDVFARAGVVDLELHGLIELARQADSLVLSLDDQFNDALSRQQKVSSSVQEMTQLSQSPPVFVAATLHLLNQVAGDPHPTFSQSFGEAEEEIRRHSQARATTRSETDYTAGPVDPSVPPHRPTRASPVPETSIGMRRKGFDTPRIFADSLHDLESDVRELGIDRVKTPGGQDVVNSTEGFRVSGICRKPVVSRSAMANLPPPLPRKESLPNRDRDVQDRTLAGATRVTRASFRESRSQTVDDSVSRLEGWLKEKPPSSASGSGLHRGKFRDRDNTL